MSFSRRSRAPRFLSSSRRHQAKRSLRLESLECRRLLAGDVAVTDSPELESGRVSGIKWEDRNENGRRDRNERGLAGVTIYADLNNNGVHDETEPATTTQRNDRFTPEDERGRFILTDLPSGTYPIREIVPAGFRQTFPRPGAGLNRPEDGFLTVTPASIDAQAAPGDSIERTVTVTVHPFCIRPFEFDVVPVSGDEVGVPGVEVKNHSGIQINGCGGDVSEFKIEIIVREPGTHRFDLAILDRFDGEINARIPVTINGSRTGAHWVTIEPGGRVDGIHFGNARISRQTGSIEGRSWRDQNGNGTQDPGELGLGGVLVYLDLNNNAILDHHEPRTRTQFENPVTDFDEAGLYSFNQLQPGSYVVREVVPRGYEQTFPQSEAVVLRSDTGKFGPGIALDLDVTEVTFSSEDGNVTTSVEMTVLWPDGCGVLLAEQTSYAVVGETIVVDLHGRQSGEFCTEALQSQSVTIDIEGLGRGEYQVVGALHEVLPEGEKATLAVVGEIRVGPSGAHRVELVSGQVVSQIDFGNRRIGNPETIHGRKWHDINGDGHRQADEPGLEGVSIYADLDGNGVWNEGEPLTKTRGASDEGPDTLGTYALEGLEPGIYTIREIVPDGFQQTYPFVGWIRQGDTSIPFRDDFPAPHAHRVVLSPGEDVHEVNFGNQKVESGSVHGLKWRDDNGNRRRDSNEPGLEGITVYADVNFNGTWEPTEPHTVTMADDPDTEDVDETGHYRLTGLSPNAIYHIREVVPENFRQTYPSAGIFQLPIFFGRPDLISFDDFFLPPGGLHIVWVAAGQVVEGIDFGNQPRRDAMGTVRGTVWNDLNGNGRRDPGEPGIAGVTVFDDVNRNGRADVNEPRAVSELDDPTTLEDDTGRYSLSLAPGNHLILQQIPQEGQQTYPSPLREVTFPYNLGHSIQTEPGETLRNVDFGNAFSTRGAEVTDPGPGTDGDVNGDRSVDFTDFLILSANYNQEVDQAFASGDLDGDQMVSFADFLILSAAFGTQAT